jgi:phosphatidate cytidylyltransferase
LKVPASLKVRVLTALVILPATLAVVFLTPAWAFRLVVTLVLLMGSLEFRSLAGLTPAAGWGLFGLQAVILALLHLTWPGLRADAILLLAVGCITWLLMFTRLWGYRDSQGPDDSYRRLSFISALATVTFCWIALIWLRERPQGALVVFLLLLVIWASDVGAYFAGSLFGKHKLAPAISPKKTWEGVFGGIVLAQAAAFLYTYAIAGLAVAPAAVVVTTLATTLASIGGDLFISVHKRTVQLKDTGTLFPGHGGVLDRYDSLLAGSPFFALALGVLTL